MKTSDCFENIFAGEEDFYYDDIGLIYKSGKKKGQPKLVKIERYDRAADPYTTDRAFNKWSSTEEGSRLFDEAYTNPEFKSNYEYFEF